MSITKWHKWEEMRIKRWRKKQRKVKWHKGLKVKNSKKVVKGREKIQLNGCFVELEPQWNTFIKESSIGPLAAVKAKDTGLAKLTWHSRLKTSIIPSENHKSGVNFTEKGVTRRACWEWPLQRRCTRASPKPTAAGATAAAARTATTSRGPAPWGGPAPGLHPRRPAPPAPRGTAPPERPPRTLAGCP